MFSAIGLLQLKQARRGHIRNAIGANRPRAVVERVRTGKQGIADLAFGIIDHRRGVEALRWPVGDLGFHAIHFDWHGADEIELAAFRSSAGIDVYEVNSPSRAEWIIL